MIVIDADVILIDARYPTDTRYPKNRAALDRLRAEGHSTAMVAHAVMEVVGVMSYGTPAADVPRIPDALRVRYGVAIFPDLTAPPEYAGCSYQELLDLMTTKMNLGDAVQVPQIRKYVPAAAVFLTWNLKHFRGRLPVPVLTPAEWLQQQAPAGPTP